MDKLKDLIIESSLARIWSHIEGDTTFGIMSAERGTLSPTENARRSITLKNDIRNVNCGFIELRGAWTENGETTYEKSFFIPNIKREDILELGHKYNQTAVLFKDEHEFVLISTNEEFGIGTVIITYAKSKGAENLQIGVNALQQAFSYLAKGSHRGKKFGFTLQEAEEKNWMRMMYIEKVPLRYYDIFTTTINQ